MIWDAATTYLIGITLMSKAAFVFGCHACLMCKYEHTARLIIRRLPLGKGPCGKSLDPLPETKISIRDWQALGIGSAGPERGYSCTDENFGPYFSYPYNVLVQMQAGVLVSCPKNPAL